jgi:hypothetical protein
MSLYSQLFLRETASPYGDINRNSTLSFRDLDQNFIFLKERDINQLKIVGSNLIYETLGGTEYSVNIGGASTNNTFVTGFTFNSPSTYDLTIEQNQGEPPLTVDLSSLASDVYVLSGSYDPSTGDVEFTNSTGGTFVVSGFTTGMTDSYTTAANLNGNTIEFDNNIQGSNLYNVSLSPILSGKTDLTLFNSHTGDTNNPHQTSFSNLTATAHTHTISDVINLQTELDSKTNNIEFISHTGNTTIHFTKGDINLSDLGSTAHTHTLSEITDFNSYSGNVQTQLDGKIETASNIGGGEGLFSGKSGTDLQFRSISGGSNTTATTVGDVVRIDVSVPADVSLTGSPQEVAFMNASGDDLSYDSGFTWSGTLLTVNDGDISVSNTYANLLSDLNNSVLNTFTLSGANTTLSEIKVTSSDSEFLSFGTRGSAEPTFSGYGENGDSYIYSSTNSNGLNVISASGTGTDDYIRFYTGRFADGSPDIHIQGTGSTKGYVGIGVGEATKQLDINGELRIRSIGSTTSVTNLGVDIDGNVVSGTTGGVFETAGLSDLSIKDSIGGHTVSTGSSHSIIAGGTGNTVDGDYIAVLGGSGHSVDYMITYAGILGGKGTTLSGASNSGVVGGEFNTMIIAGQSAIIGGESNTINECNRSVINGGYGHQLTKTSTYSFLGGGKENQIDDYGERSAIVGGWYNLIQNTASDSAIVGGRNNTLRDFSRYSGMLGGRFHNMDSASNATLLGGIYNTISGSSHYGSIVGGSGNTIDSAALRTVILGGNNITATASDTVYVPNLNIGEVGGGTSIMNLGIDASGNVVSGLTSDNFYVTGGTLTDGTLTLRRNDDDTVDITGFTEGCEVIVTNVGTGNSELYSLPLSANTGAFFDYVVSGDTGVRSGSLTTVFSGTSANIADLSTDDIGDTSDVSFNVTLDSIEAKLNVSAVTGTWRIEFTPTKCDVTSTVDGGEITTATNIGSGEGLFSGKSGVELQFKTLTSTGGTVTITSTGDTVNLESSGGGGGSGIVYIASGTTSDLLDDTNNWNINGEYTGTTISGTLQGYAHYNSDYWFTAVDDNDWIRLIRG